MRIYLPTWGLLTWLSLQFAFAQQSEKPFFYAKSLLLEGKYQAAMEVFQNVAQNPQEKQYFEYACYFYAYCAYQADKPDDALRWLALLQQTQPNWEKINEAKYLEALCYIEKKEYYTALQKIQTIKDYTWQTDVFVVKKNILAQLSIDELQKLYAQSDEDRATAEVLYHKLQEVPLETRDTEQIVRLAKRLTRNNATITYTSPDKTKVQPKTSSIIKIALLLPFALDENTSSARQLRNQYVFDLYEGIRIASQLLMEANVGCIINFLVFDSNKDSIKINQIFANPEFQRADLIIGPLHPNTVPLVKEFSKRHQIPMVNPLSTNPQVIEGNPYAFLVNSTPETHAAVASNFAKQTLQAKNAYIVYDNLPVNKQSAEIFRKNFEEKGGKVRLFYSFNSGKQGYKILADSLAKLVTEKDACLYAATTDVTTAFNIVSTSLSLNLNTPILADYSWLEFDQLKFNQLERANVHFLYPQYQTENESLTVQRFTSLYIDKLGILPSKFVKIGFETMYIFGEMLCKYDKKLVSSIHQEKFMKGVFTEGYDYTYGNDNQYIPILKLNNGKLELLNRR